MPNIRSDKGLQPDGPTLIAPQAQFWVPPVAALGAAAPEDVGLGKGKAILSLALRN
jgi:hypothetical protein